MTTIDATSDPIPAILKSKGLVLRGLALAAGIVGLFLPGLTGTQMGITQVASVMQLGGWFFIAPISIGIALIVPGFAPRYSRLVDIVATTLVAAVAAYAAYIVFDAMSQMSQVAQATGNMLGNNSAAQAYTQALGMNISPGPGLLVMAAATVLMAVQSFLPRK